MAFLALLPSLMALEQGGDSTAVDIARAALLTSPPGKWDMAGSLETRISPGGKCRETSGECSLSIQFQPLEGGGHQATYRLKTENGETGEGVVVVVPREPMGGGLRVLDLKTRKSVGDVRASLFGSLFSLEDVAMKFLSWKSQSWTGQDTLKDRACLKLESRPGKGDVTRYSRVESWIDRQYGALLKAVAYDGAGSVAKEFNVRSFQQMDDVWMLKMLEVVAPESGRSRLEITDAERRR